VLFLGCPIQGIITTPGIRKHVTDVIRDLRSLSQICRRVILQLSSKHKVTNRPPEGDKSDKSSTTFRDLIHYDLIRF
jgi:hypothetical protein